MLVSSYTDILLRRLHPLSRLALSVALIVAAFSVTTLQGILVVTTVTLLIGVIGGIGNRVFKILKVAIPMLIMAFILWTFFSKYSLFYAHGEDAAVEFGLYMATRLVTLMLAPIIFISTTTPSELVASLESLRLPRALVFLVALTLRHIFSIAEEYRAIKEAQISRGLELDKGFLIRRIRNYIPVMIPLLIRSIEIADRVTLAMELKLYGVGRRTRYFRHRYAAADYVILSLVLVICSALVFVRYLVGGI